VVFGGGAIVEEDVLSWGACWLGSRVRFEACRGTAPESCDVIGSWEADKDSLDPSGSVPGVESSALSGCSLRFSVGAEGSDGNRARVSVCKVDGAAAPLADEGRSVTLRKGCLTSLGIRVGSDCNVT
jgi:hypothetical protein